MLRIKIPKDIDPQEIKEKIITLKNQLRQYIRILGLVIAMVILETVLILFSIVSIDYLSIILVLFLFYIIGMTFAFSLPIIELAVIYAIDFMKFDIISFMLMVASVFIFCQAFKGASLTARELVIYENMIEDQN